MPLENSVSIFSIANKFLKFFAVGFIIISLIIALYKTFQEKDLSIFFIELSTRIFASDKQLYDSIQSLQTATSTLQKILLYLDIFASLEILLLIINTTRKIFGIIIGTASPIFLWLIAFLIIGLIETTYLAITTPNIGLSKEGFNLIAPYKGVFSLLKNLLLILTPLQKLFGNVSNSTGFLDNFKFLKNLTS